MPAAVSLILGLLGQLGTALTQAIAAWQTNDQGTLDKLEASALAAANALRPAGTDPLT